jgi:hypothetical protein
VSVGPLVDERDDEEALSSARVSLAPAPESSRRLPHLIGFDEFVRAGAIGAYIGLLVAAIVGTGIPSNPMEVARWVFFGVAAATAGTRWRMIGLAAFGGAFIATACTGTLPINDRDLMLLWLIGAVAIVVLGRDPRAAVRLVRDWLPFVAALFIYDYSRNIALEVGMPVQITPQIDADKVLGLGKVPTVWLQRTLLAPHHFAWWEGAILIVYLSHFVVPYAAAAWLWARDHDDWWRYTVRFLTLIAVGLITYVLVPAAPPWMAAQHGALGHGVHVQRSITRGFHVLHLDLAKPVFSEGQGAVNLTAAVPSLHAAFAALVAVFFWPRVRNPIGRFLLALYPLAMAFTLVLSGEHYVIDILLGWLYVAGVMLAWRAIERRHAVRRAEPTAVVAEV